MTPFLLMAQKKRAQYRTNPTSRTMIHSRATMAVSALGGLTCFLALSFMPTYAAIGPAEKPNLKIGFIKLTDMAPLAIAYEKGFFEDEDLSVTLEAQANWKVVLDRVITGELDGSHMLAPQPIGSTVGFGTQAHIITAFTMTLNGSALTVSNGIWQEMKKNLSTENGKIPHPISSNALKPVVQKSKESGKPFQMAMVFPLSTHNYEIRYWLASSGIHPGFYAPLKGDTSGQLSADVLLSVTPPPQMPATLEAGTIQGYMVGEPWNQQAVFRGIGIPVITNRDIHTNLGDKMFGVSKAWADKHPNTHIRLVKALIRAAYWLDENNNTHRPEAAQIISQPHYVGADEKIIRNSMAGVFEYEKGDIRPEPDFNVFFRYNANYPYYSDAIWYLTQMRRWGQIPEAKPDSWYLETAQKVFQPEIFQKAVSDLIAEKKMKASDFTDFKTLDGFRKPTDTQFLDGKTFDATKPNDYLKQFEIGLKGDEKV